MDNNRSVSFGLLEKGNLTGPPLTGPTRGAGPFLRRARNCRHFKECVMADVKLL